MENYHISDKANQCSNESKCATYGEGMTVKSKKKEYLKDCKLLAEWEDGELFKTEQEKTSLQEQTFIHTLDITDAKWVQKRKEN